MKERSSIILAHDAAGELARCVLPALPERGVNVRVILRCEADPEAMRAPVATEVPIGDLDNGRSLDVAQGIDSVICIAPVFPPAEAGGPRGPLEALRQTRIPNKRLSRDGNTVFLRKRRVFLRPL